MRDSPQRAAENAIFGDPVSGGFYDGAFLPVFFHTWVMGYGLELDTRFWDPDKPKTEGVEFRLAGRHFFDTLEVGARVHHNRIRMLVEGHLTPAADGGTPNYAWLLGIGFDFLPEDDPRPKPKAKPEATHTEMPIPTESLDGSPFPP